MVNESDDNFRRVVEKLKAVARILAREHGLNEDEAWRAPFTAGIDIVVEEDGPAIAVMLLESLLPSLKGAISGLPMGEGFATSPGPVPSDDEIAGQLWPVIQQSLIAGAKPMDVALVLLNLCLAAVTSAFGPKMRSKFLARAVATEHALDEAAKRRLS